MNENMNRFAFNTEGKICDYGYEEPKVLTEQEILEELNHLENTKNHFWEECEDVNWQNECLKEELDKAIVPKFNIGQEVWFISLTDNICNFVIEDLQFTLCGDGKSAMCYYDKNNVEQFEWDLFATEQEARAKLKELQNK